VDADDAVGVADGEPVGDVGADVAAVGAEPLVAEHVGQQPGQGVGDHRTGHRAGGRQVGEDVAGQRRHDHVEGVGGVAAVAAGVGQQRHQQQHLGEGARPAVGQEQGQWRGAAGDADAGHVDEVQQLPVEVGAVVRDGVERLLPSPPVEPVGPVGQQLPQVVGIGARRPRRTGGAGRQTGPGKPGAQVVEDDVGHVDGERRGRHRWGFRA